MPDFARKFRCQLTRFGGLDEAPEFWLSSPVATKLLNLKDVNCVRDLMDPISSLFSLCATFAINEALSTTASEPLRGVVASAKQKVTSKVCQVVGKAPLGPSANHDIQRAIALAYVRCAERWLHNLKASRNNPNPSDSERELLDFCDRTQVYVAKLERRVRQQSAEFELDARPDIVDMLIGLVPESLSARQDMEAATKALADIFAGFVKEADDQELPTAALMSLYEQRSREPKHILFGHDVFRAFLDILKSGEYPEATLAFEFRMFGELRVGLREIKMSVDTLGLVPVELDYAKQRIAEVLLEVNELGIVAGRLAAQLRDQGKTIEKLQLDITEIHREILECVAVRNTISLDRKSSVDSAQLATYINMRFEQRQTKFVGRDKEIGELHTFLDDDRPIGWWQVAGGGGQGKSRLALHFLDTLSADWHAGFLGAGDLDQQWDTITFRDPTLIIVDYVAAPSKARRFIDAIKKLHRRAHSGNGSLPPDTIPLGQKVRFLVLEREGYDTGDISGQRASSWYSLVNQSDTLAMSATRHAPQAMTLNDLRPETMITIADSWRTRDGSDLDPLTNNEAQQLITLMGGNPDSPDSPSGRAKAWRPLFAMMIGEYLDRFGSNAAGDEEIYHILRQAFEAEQQDYWDKDTDGRVKKLPEPALNLACLATMCGSYDHHVHLEALEGARDDGSPVDQFYGPFDEAIFRQASTALGYHTNPARGGDRVLPLSARQPDLLGEFLVIWSLEAGKVHGITRFRKRTNRLVSDCLVLVPRQLQEFVNRLASDFPRRDTTVVIRNAYESALSRNPVKRKGQFAPEIANIAFD